MISNERPSPYGRRPDQGLSQYQQPRPVIQEDTIKSGELQVERKSFRFTLKENPRGRFLRITEEAGNKRNAVIVPSTGLEEFQRVMTEMLQTARTMPATSPAEEPGDSIGNR